MSLLRYTKVNGIFGFRSSPLTIEFLVLGLARVAQLYYQLTSLWVNLILLPINFSIKVNSVDGDKTKIAREVVWCTLCKVEGAYKIILIYIPYNCWDSC